MIDFYEDVINFQLLLELKSLKLQILTLSFFGY